MGKKPKLLILRGPSGSGKSTVAKELFDNAKGKTVLLQQDHYRFIFRPNGLSKTGKEMIFSDAKLALDDDYDVILEGIFTTKSYTKYFEKLIKMHPKESYMFYFDISFAETLKRHVTKPNSHEFGEKDMREWYKPKDYSKFDFEYIIAETNSLQQTLEQIRKVASI